MDFVTIMRLDGRLPFVGGSHMITNCALWRHLRGAPWQPLVLAAFTIYIFFVGSRHEPWFDEGQSWLVARDSGLIELFTDRVRYEGSPGLWHLVLWITAHIGLPFASLNVLSALLAIGAAAVVLWCGPFPAMMRISILGSYYFAYQFSIVARSYALDLILIPLVATLYAVRRQRPIAFGLLIGLLANCNAHSLLIAGILGLDFLIDLYVDGRLWRRDAQAGIAIAVLLGVFAVLTAWQPADHAFPPEPSEFDAFVKVFDYIRDAFVDRGRFWDDALPPPENSIMGIMISFALLLPSLLLFMRAGKLPLAISIFASLIAFSSAVYSNHWHSGLLFLAWLFCIWISWAASTDHRELKIVVATAATILCLMQAAQAARSAAWDIDKPYSAAASAAPAVARWRNENPSGKIAAVGFKAFALQPYFPANIFANYHGGAARPSYMEWTAVWRKYVPEEDGSITPPIGNDLLVVSHFSVLKSQLGLEITDSCGASYRRIGFFPGANLWRGYVVEDDSISLYARIDGSSARTCNAPFVRKSVAIKK